MSKKRLSSSYVFPSIPVDNLLDCTNRSTVPFRHNSEYILHHAYIIGVIEPHFDNLVSCDLGATVRLALGNAGPNEFRFLCPNRATRTLVAYHVKTGIVSTFICMGENVGPFSAFGHVVSKLVVSGSGNSNHGDFGCDGLGFLRERHKLNDIERARAVFLNGPIQLVVSPTAMLDDAEMGAPALFNIVGVSNIDLPIKDINDGINEIHQGLVSYVE